MSALAHLPLWSRMTLLAVTALLINLPFGAWRVRSRKFSLPWFLSIHAPIPLAFLLRRMLSLSIWFVALTLLFAVAGQLAGGRLWPPAVPEEDSAPVS